jgi:hypothetical protein
VRDPAFRLAWCAFSDLPHRRLRFRVLAVVPFEEEDESPFVGLLQVQAV